MTRRAHALAAVALVLVLAATLAAQEPPPLPALQAAKVEAHQLRVENAQLRAALAQLQAELDSARLTAERAVLEAELRETLKPPVGHVFDWSTKRFVPPQEPK